MTKHNILVTGGCGFIGTQVANKLYELGHNVTIVDRNITNQNSKIKTIKDDYLIHLLTPPFIKYDTIVHLAAEHIVPQSLLEPEKYYTNNVVKLKSMLGHMVDTGIKNIIFSSTGNLYGRQRINNTLKEDMYYDPQNPYASSKVACELIIRDYANAYGIKYVNFRYFNVVGADPTCRFGYTQRPATHIIPVLCNKIKNEGIFQIFGNDYPTKDGTCIRDYVHVADIATAHVKAIDFLDAGNSNDTFNLGGGSLGISVKDLIDHVSIVLNKVPVVEYMGRRTGDPAMLVANIDKAKQILNWEPEYNIRDAILHAWNWETKFETDK